MGLKNPFAEFNASHMDIEELIKYWIKPSPIFEVQAMGIDLTGFTPVIFMGGRGTGKTMMLKYLSNEFQIQEFLLTHKNDVNINASQYWNDHTYIGIYHRFDGACLSSFEEKNVTEIQWSIIFTHYFELVIGQKIIESMINFQKQGIITLTREQEINIADRIISLIFPNASSKQDSRDLQSVIDKMQFVIDGIFTFLNEAPLIDNPHFDQRPIYSQNKLTHGIANILIQNCDSLKNKKFILLLDEYENLMEFQQKIINTSIKHVKPPVTFRIGMRLNGFKTVDTLNRGEFLTEDADYRKILFENIMYSNSAKYEEFLKNIANKRLQNIPEFKSNGLTNIEQILGELSPIQEACLVVHGKTNPDFPIDINEYLKFKHVLKIKQELDRLKGSHNTENPIILQALIFPENPLVDMVNLLLLRRSELNVNEIVEMFASYKQKKLDSSYYKKYYDLYSKNEVALLFQLISIYRPKQKEYAGFKTFVMLSSGITRNFLELCYQSFNYALFADPDNLLKSKSIPYSIQTKAAKNRAEKVLGTVEVIPLYGNQIQNLVYSLGKIFASTYFDPRISEPEITYFEVNKSELSLEAIKILNSAVQWSVFQEKPPMKGRTVLDSYLNVYVMNHILAPYFTISYRIRGRLKRFEKNEIEDILFGDSKQRDSVIRKRVKYDIESDSYQVPLGRFDVE